MFVFEMPIYGVYPIIIDMLMHLGDLPLSARLALPDVLASGIFGRFVDEIGAVLPKGCIPAFLGRHRSVVRGLRCSIWGCGGVTMLVVVRMSA